MIAPDVGTLVTYQGHQYRVSSWMKVATPQPTAKELIDKGVYDLNAVLSAILFDGCRQFDGDNRLQWCTREEATHLELVGVAGAMAPIAECIVTGRVNWPDEQIAEEREQALGLVGEVLF